MKNLITLGFLTGLSFSSIAQELPQAFQICPQQTTVLRSNYVPNLDASGGYLWYKDGVPMGVQGPSDSLLVSTSGVYTLSTFNSSGCASLVSAPVVIDLNAPRANHDFYMVNEGVSMIVNMTSNDVQGCALINNSTVSLTSNPVAGTITFGANGEYIYTAPGYDFGLDSFKYIVTDSLGMQSNMATVYLSYDASVPLAVQIKDFSAKNTGSYEVTLDWVVTQSEKCDFFSIEKSKNGKDFLEIGRVSAKRNTSADVSYVYTDHQALSGANYYRLKMVDFNSQVIYGDVRLVRIGSNINNVTIHPVPVTSVLNIDLAGENPASIEVIDVLGKVVALAERNGDKAKANVEHLSNGTYFIKLVNGDNKIELIKVVKH